MQDEHRGMALVVMGITAIVGVIGLVLMFSGGDKSTGALFTNEGYTNSNLKCDSPCTIFPSQGGMAEKGVTGHDELMMANRVTVAGREFTKVFDVVVPYADGTYFTGGCYCPPQGNPAFGPTQEFAALIPGTSSGIAEYDSRAAGVPVDKYTQINYPGMLPSDVPNYKDVMNQYPMQPNLEGN